MLQRTQRQLPCLHRQRSPQCPGFTTACHASSCSSHTPHDSTTADQVHRPGFHLACPDNLRYTSRASPAKVWPQGVRTTPLLGSTAHVVAHTLLLYGQRLDTTCCSHSSCACQATRNPWLSSAKATRRGVLLGMYVQSRSYLTPPAARDQHNGQAYALDRPVASAFYWWVAG